MDNESSYSGGYRLNFVDEVSENLLCIFCHFPSCDPQLSTCCGYNMCRRCLDGYKQLVTMAQKILSCPKCCYYDFKVYPNKMSDRQIYNLVVLCSNGKAGCKWRGKLNELNGHLENICQYEIVDCPKGCEVSLPRRDIAPHVKLECSRLVINCPHCLVRGEKHFIEGRHLEECANLPLNCPNHCGATISDTEALSEHKNICPLEIVSCEYNDLGCNIDMARRDVEVHNRENLTKHLNLAKQKLVCSTKELESSKTQLNIVEERLRSLKNRFAYSIEEVLSMIRLLDQLNLEKHKKEKSNSLRQISLYYKSLLLLQGNQVAPVILKMNKFEEHRRNGSSWFSPPFFTHNHGYRLLLCVVAAGHDAASRKDNFMSLGICVMQGHYDNEVTWPMEGVVRVCLLNQLSTEDNDDGNYVMTICLPDAPLFPVNCTLRVTTGGEEAGIKSPMGLMSSTMLGTNKFISLEMLAKLPPSCKFLKDDCIFFKVEYGKSLDDFASPKKSGTDRGLESKPLKQNPLRFYRTPQQDVPLTFEDKEPAHVLQNKPVNQSSPGDCGSAKEVQQTPVIPETVTSL